MKNRFGTLFLGLFLLASCLNVKVGWAEELLARAEAIGYSLDEIEDTQDTTAEEWDEEEPPIRDPWEKYNRKIFKFNDKMYDYVLMPFSKGYDFLVPKKVQGSINNFFTNVRTPIRLFNCVFQGKWKNAGGELGRFAINTTVGVGGFFDPAKAAFHIELKDEDFGQTIGHHGMGSGPYVVWPLLGPSSVRDTIGFIGDAALNPLTWLNIYDVEPEEAFVAAGGVQQVNNFSYNTRENYKSIRKSALDPYTSIKHAYIQNRIKRIKE